MKVCGRCGGDAEGTKDGENVCEDCERELNGEIKKRFVRKQIRTLRKSRDNAMESLGLVKVRGALGGTYWE